MSFKSRDNRFLIEEASSGRARCRRCKQPIPNGALRLRIVAFVCPGRSTAFFRCCLDAKLAAAVLAVYGSAARVPCAPTVDAARADQMRNALSLAVRARSLPQPPTASRSPPQPPAAPHGLCAPQVDTAQMRNALAAREPPEGPSH